MYNRKSTTIVLKSTIEILIIAGDIFFEGVIVGAPDTPLAVVIDEIKVHAGIAAKGIQRIGSFLTRRNKIFSVKKVAPDNRTL
jgi:hypothetical protein